MTLSTGSAPANPAAMPVGVLSAWQAALAAEHAAIFGYGALGPRLPAADTPLARADEAAHRAVRDATATAVVAAGADPIASRADYPLPHPLDSPLRARRFAVQLETTCASAWRYLLAAASTAPITPTASTTATTAGALLAIRRSGQASLTSSAVRAMRWRARVDPAAPTEPFPGI